MEKSTALAAEDPRVPECFALIDAELDNCTELLAMSATRPFTAAKVVEVASLAARLVGVLNQQLGVHLEPPAYSAELVRIDPDELEMALFCLIENAVDLQATCGGTVELRCSPAPERRITLEVLNRGEKVEALQQAAQAYASTFTGKHGLGLNIARRITVRWGGTFELTGSGDGVGAALTFATCASA